MKEKADHRARHDDKFIKYTLDLNFNFEDFGGDSGMWLHRWTTKIMRGSLTAVKGNPEKGIQGKGER
ncbi:MAG TPA: hypothetical protein VIQ24_04795 [Pyrinomonadaceae bacterium]